MNLENYKILKLSNKEMIICEMSSESPDSYEIINPLKMDVMPRMSANGEVNEVLNLRPWLQHISEQKYISVNKSHCIIIVDASVGLSRYYEHFIRKIEDDDNESNEEMLSPEKDEYDELLLEAKTDSKLIH